MYELQQISIRKTQADQAIENEPEVSIMIPRASTCIGSTWVFDTLNSRMEVRKAFNAWVAFCTKFWFDNLEKLLLQLEKC